MTVDIRGSMFTREFVIEFAAPKDDIAAWLNASPGTADALLQVDTPSQVISIKPGGGAMFAEVQVDWSSGRVRIRTFWS